MDMSYHQADYLKFWTRMQGSENVPASMDFPTIFMFM
jgi:hypothetical protein